MSISADVASRDGPPATPVVRKSPADDRVSTVMNAIGELAESASGDMPTFLGGLTAHLAALLGVEKVGFCSLDPAGVSVSQERGAFGFSQEQHQRLHHLPTDPLRGDVGGEIVFGEETASLPSETIADSAYGKAVRIAGARDGVALAWKAGRQPLGLVHVWNSTRGGLNDEDIQVLRVAATAAGLVWQQQRITLELTEARHEAERANNAKNDFLSRISHELRTPLAAVLGYAELLELSWLEDGQREQVAAILRGGTHLLELITDILDISRIEMGTMPLTLVPVDLNDMAREAVDLITPLAAQRSIQVTTRLRSRLAVMADSQRLKQVLVNLLSNAVKYNREGGQVTITMSRSGDIGARISVTDDGHGIDPQNLHRLFVPFERLDAASRGIDGTGLGLALSRNLIEAMNGSMGVRSTVGEGSTFWIDLELADPVARRRRGARDTHGVMVRSVRPATVLYIEDTHSNVTLIGEILARRPGITLAAAATGAQGVELARAAPPDLILLDVHLPDMRGDDVIAQLNARSETAAIPVVVLTADATDDQRERLLKAGARAYLTRPASVRTVLGVVDEILNLE